MDVLHELEVCASFLDLLDASWGQFVGKLAKDDSIAQNVLIVAGWYRLAQNGIDPVENFLLLFLVTLLPNVTDDSKS